MILIGEDTKEFLQADSKLEQYLTALDTDFAELGANKNYIMLTHLELPQENDDELESVICICFYFTNIPKDTKIEDCSKVLSDHVDMIENLNVFLHFAQVPEESVLELGDNPSRESRSDFFLETVYR